MFILGCLIALIITFDILVIINSINVDFNSAVL